jgi:thymidylate synthase (FAD)
MKIEVVGRTTTLISAIEAYMVTDDEASGMEDLVEFAGRACYQSFHKPNAGTRKNEDYIANILAQQHESVLEHASVSFYVQGVSRNMLLELERHRHLSFSVISTRFVDMSQAMVVVPPALLQDGTPNLEPLSWDARNFYEELVDVLMQEGLTRKQAREAARYRLPGNLETKFVVTGNLRAWRDVLRKRYSVWADAEIRHFASAVLDLLRIEAPSVFQDFPEAPFQ